MRWYNLCKVVKLHCVYPRTCVRGRPAYSKYREDLLIVILDTRGMTMNDRKELLLESRTATRS